MSETPPDFLAGGGPLVVRLTFSSGGASTSLTSVKIPMIVSNVYRLQFVIPDGCAQLCKFGVFRKERKVYPINPEEWLDGNNEVLNFETDVNVESGEEWTLRGFNEDTTYDHTITIRIYIREIDERSLRALLAELIGGIADLSKDFKSFADLWQPVPVEEVQEEDVEQPDLVPPDTVAQSGDLGGNTSEDSTD